MTIREKYHEIEILEELDKEYEEDIEAAERDSDDPSFIASITNAYLKRKRSLTAPVRICPKCSNVVSFNSYFGAYICNCCNWEDATIGRRRNMGIKT